ncbi:hypothetical protein, partial [Escherichia coli]|uniref:hypothetical protein n=1 Tax=Escherichia coli TaxID=562 RepID=UPI001AD935F6
LPIKGKEKSVPQTVVTTAGISSLQTSGKSPSPKRTNFDIHQWRQDLTVRMNEIEAAYVESDADRNFLSSTQPFT